MVYFGKKRSIVVEIVGIIAIVICTLAYPTQSINCVPNEYCTIKEGSVLSGYYTTKINRRDISLFAEKKYNSKHHFTKHGSEYLRYAPVITLNNNTEIELQYMQFNTPEAAEALVTDIQQNKQVTKRGLPIISSFGIYY